MMFIICQWELAFKIEGLYESLFTIINTLVEIAIQQPSWEVMIFYERLYNKQ